MADRAKHCGAARSGDGQTTVAMDEKHNMAVVHHGISMRLRGISPPDEDGRRTLQQVASYEAGGQLHYGALWKPADDRPLCAISEDDYAEIPVVTFSAEVSAVIVEALRAHGKYLSGRHQNKTTAHQASPP